MLRDSVNLIKDVHIVNLTTEKGTFSDDYGQYRIIVSLGDTLEFTSVQYLPVKKVISDRFIYSKKMNVLLKKKNYVLDEIILKKNNLTGYLLSDRRKVPIDSMVKISKNMNNLINDQAKKTTQRTINNQNNLSEVTSNYIDPTKSFRGVGSSISFAKGKKKKKKILKITSDTFSNKNILKDLGEEFFIELKIPHNKINSFIDYCKKFNLKKLYEQNKILELITLIEKMSADFLQYLK